MTSTSKLQPDAPPVNVPTHARDWVVRSPYREYQSFPSLKEAEEAAAGCAAEFPGDDIVIYEAVQVRRHRGT